MACSVRVGGVLQSYVDWRSTQGASPHPQENSVRPRKDCLGTVSAARRRVLGSFDDGQVLPEEVREVALLTEVDAHEGVAGLARQRLDEAALAHAGAALQENRTRKLRTHDAGGRRVG